MRTKELNKAISKIQPNRKADNVNILVDEDGHLRQDLQESVAVASIMGTVDSKIYKVRTNSEGHFYDPNESRYKLNYKPNSIDKTTGTERFKFRVVTEQAFNDYVKFLATKNNSQLLIAERNK